MKKNFCLLMVLGCSLLLLSLRFRNQHLPQQKTAYTNALTDSCNKSATVKIYYQGIANRATPILMMLKNTHGTFYAIKHKEGYFEFNIPVYYPQFVSLYKSNSFNDQNAIGESFYISPGSSNVLRLNEDIKYRRNNQQKETTNGELPSFPYIQMEGANAHINNLIFTLKNDYAQFYNDQLYDQLSSSSLLSPRNYRIKVTQLYKKALVKITQMHEAQTINNDELKILNRSMKAALAYGLMSYPSCHDLLYDIAESEVTTVVEENIELDNSVFRYPSIYTDTAYRSALIEAFADSALLYSFNFQSVSYRMLHSKAFSKPKPGIKGLMEYLLRKGNVLNTEENALYKFLCTSEFGAKSNDFDVEKQFNALNKFNLKHQKELQTFHESIAGITDVAYLQNFFKLSDWEHDILLFQTTLEKIENIEWLTKAGLINKIGLFKTASFVKILSNQIDRNLATLPVEGAVIGQFPKKMTASLFHYFKQQYPGKIIVVNLFYSGFNNPRQIMKENSFRGLFKTEPVVFVDLVSNNGGIFEQSWNNCLKYLRGYHYNISYDDFNQLIEKNQDFRKSNFVILDQSGALVPNDSVSSFDSAGLKRWLEKLLNNPKLQ